MNDRENLRILVIREGDMLVAQCLEFDICTQAKDMRELKERLHGLIEMERAEGRDATGRDFGDLGPAPTEFHEMWEHADRFEGGGNPYRIALAA